MTALTLTSRQAAEQTGISVHTLRSAARDGDLEVRWLGPHKWVVEPDELMAWVRSLPSIKPGSAA